MATITREQVTKINTKCDNGFKLDLQHAILWNEKQLEKEILINGNTKIVFTLYFKNEYAAVQSGSYTFNQATGNVIPTLKIDKWVRKDVDGNVWSSYTQGHKINISNETSKRRNMTILQKLTNTLNDELLSNYITEYYPEVATEEAPEAEQFNIFDLIDTTVLTEEEQTNIITTIGTEEETEIINQIEEVEEVGNTINFVLIGEPQDVQEDATNNITIEEPKQEETIEDIKVVLNDAKNGVEIHFIDKPEEDTRNMLKANGFKWSRYNKCWYATQSKDTLNFAYSLSGTNKEEIQETSAAYKEEKEQEKKEYINNSNIEDVSNYKVDPAISKRENDNAFIRTKERNHTQELQNTLKASIREVKEVLNSTDNINIQYNLIKALESYKKNYSSNYIAMIAHKANNPSWAVTGRAGRNARQDEKKASRYDNLIRNSIDIEDKLEKAIDRAKNAIRKERNQQQESKVNQVDQVPEFTRVKKLIDIYNNKNILVESSNSTLKQVYQYQDYFILKCWGAFRIFTNAGQEIHGMKTTDTLEAAKKWLTYHINNLAA